MCGGVYRSTIPRTDRTLTPEETSLLSKRLNICPQRHFKVLETVLDINKLI